MNQKIKRFSFVIALCMLWLVSFAQKTVTGHVTDAQGEALIGVSVMVKGSTTGTVTDFDGNYSLQSVPSTAQIQFSYIGYQTKTVIVGSNSTINVVLDEDNAALDEVVVIGYQTIRRRDLTGSVSSVSGKNIASAPVSDVTQALQGKLAGVNIVSQDGRPDASVAIRVRGGGSISQSNEPLILIDGVAGSLSDIPADQVETIDVLKDASSTAIYGARGANGVILVTTKGAKEGKVSVSYNGYAKFNTPTKYLEALDPYDYLAYVWATADAYDATGSYRTPLEHLYGLANGGINQYKNVSKYDVQKDVYGNSFSHNHDLSISGGTDKTKVLLSMSYMDEEGLKVNSYKKRANISLKVNQKIFKNLDFALDTRYVDVTTMSNESTTSGSGSVLSFAYRFRPIASQDIKGDLAALQEGTIGNFAKQTQWDMYSPYERLIDYEPLTQRQTLRATASLNWQIVKGLTYHTDLTLARGWNQNKYWGGATYNTYLDENTGDKLWAGSVDFSQASSWSTRWTNTLNYVIDIAKGHNLNVLAGHEVTNSGGSGTRIFADHFPANFTKDNAFAMINQYDAANSTATNFSSSWNTPSRILSFFGRLNYNMLDRYLLTVTFRADGSSKFAPSHRWGYFPAAAFAWRISEEPFMAGTKSWLDNLKLRLSYGTVGNDGISADLWSQTWTAEADNRWRYTLGGVRQAAYDLSSTQMANDDLKWETTITRNLGLDFGFLNGRLWGTIDLYWNTTKDLLMNTTLPGITGFTSTFANIGQTSNRGIELSLGGVIYKDKDWNITAGANINFNKGKVDELSEGITGQYGTQWIQMNRPSDDYILIEGEPVGLVRGLVYDGFYTTNDFDYANGTYTLKAGVPDLTSSIVPEFAGIGANERPSGQIAYPGMAKYKDLDGNGSIDTDDYTVIGDMNPTHTGGFNINASYKGFDLGMYFNWSYGNKIYNVNKLASLYGYKEGGVLQNKLAFMKDAYKIYDIVNGELVRYTEPTDLARLNTNAQYPLAYNSMGVVSSLGIEDGSYLRLNTLTLGYTLPKHIINKIGLSNLRIYGTVYNLLTITGYDGLDPEVNANANQGNSIYPTTGLDWGTYPRARSFVVGLNVNF